MSDYIDPHQARDIAWREAARAFDRKPHRPVRMQSCDSQSPLKSWCCPFCCATGGKYLAYSVTTEAPVCYGATDPYV